MAVAHGTGGDQLAGGETAGLLDWHDTYERLSRLDAAVMTGTDLDLLADALFWIDRSEESIAARRDAYGSHVESGAFERAALSAWRLFYDHWLVGETAVANGWLERARSHAAETDSSLALGWLALAEVDCALAAGQIDEALTRARRAVEIGRERADHDLVAMGLQATGRALIAAGRIREGIDLLDEAMIAVVNGELDPLFTGWIFCNVLTTCHDIADLGRAAEWTAAALRWCDGVRDGLLYRGICRIHDVELACLKGAWGTAADDARRACDELTTHDPRYAGEAFYLAGEVRRLQGDLEGAQEAFTRAHELGRLPQPGLALVRLAQDRPEPAAKALEHALEPGPSAPLPRAQLLAAQVEVQVRMGQIEAARAAADELLDIARSTDSRFLTALAAAARGSVHLAEDDTSSALERLRDACATFQDLGFPYEAARVQRAIGVASRRAGDLDTATLELRSALLTFERLGAAPDVLDLRALLEPEAEPETPLTRREVEVLQLVAEGSTNREIAGALFVSEHTVARHLSNIFNKTGATSRSGATAYAYEHGLV